jgi:hypothetical protein
MVDGAQGILSENLANQPFTWSSFRDLLYPKHSSGLVEPPKSDPPGVLVFGSWGSANGGP